MEKRPKVSVIIPVYNVEKYVGQCLESVLNQTLSDVEIIVVNDGSPDNSVEIVRQYMKQDRRIRLVEKENGGLSSARNAGMRVASGMLFMFLDSDDYLAENACERVYEVYRNTRAEIIVYGAHLFPRGLEADEWLQKKTTTRDILYQPFKPAALIKEAGGSPFAWNKAFTSEFLHSVDVEFNEKVRYGEDLIFSFQTLPAAEKIQFISDRLYFYRCRRPDSLMNSVGMEEEKLLKHHIYNLGVITHYWYRKKWLKKWRMAYEIWFLYFLVPDIMKMKREKRTVFLNCVLKIMNRYRLKSRGLLKCLKGASRFIDKIEIQKEEIKRRRY